MENDTILSLCIAGTDALLAFRNGKRWTGFIAHGKDDALLLVRTNLPEGDARARAFSAQIAQSNMPAKATAPYHALPSQLTAALLRYCVVAMDTLGETGLKECYAQTSTSMCILFHLSMPMPPDHGFLGYIGEDGKHHVDVFYSMRQFKEIDRELQELGEVDRAANLQSAAAVDFKEEDPEGRERFRFSGDLAAQCNIGYTITEYGNTMFVMGMGPPRDPQDRQPDTQPGLGTPQEAIVLRDGDYDIIDDDPVPDSEIRKMN